MTVAYDAMQGSSAHGAVALNDKYEILKEIGDGSFGSVAVARVRSAGATKTLRRGTAVAVKTMKKSFDSIAPCLELREVIFLQKLPHHIHLVPALDIFLDPFSKKLHIAMEYMDGNLYQLMKSRDHKPMDGYIVKSILYQILAGLEHIHNHQFFHRDIKPENILVSTSAPQDTGNALKRYSQLITPPPTPPVYSIKIADFGLAREIRSKSPYTTYVSTRWYRAPEVLLRAGEYSAPVDIWALGAMAVEVATLKPLFPGGNEVDQVWRVCEIMGSPGNWVNKQGAKVGGGEWRDGIKLAHKLGFSFPKMAPHTMDSILTAPQWPVSLANFVTWCLLWDPKSRPTSTEALRHEYFADAYDPLQPRSSDTRLLTRRQSDFVTPRDSAADSNGLSSKSTSWFRRSLVGRESAPAVPLHVNVIKPVSPLANDDATRPPSGTAIRPVYNKRATWTEGVPMKGAPMLILPTIRPVSPLSNTVTAQAAGRAGFTDRAVKKIGRQLSVASNANQYTDAQRQEAEPSLNQSGLASPANGQKESFFSHLRKRARRLSGRHQTPISPPEDIEANAGCAPWATQRSSMILDANLVNQASNEQYAELDRALQNVKHSLEASARASHLTPDIQYQQPVQGNVTVKRNHSVPRSQDFGSTESSLGNAATTAPVSSRTRRALQRCARPSNRYDTPDEEDELLDEALASAHHAVANMDRIIPLHTSKTRPPIQQSITDPGSSALSYPTPSQSANRNSVSFGHTTYSSSPTKPIPIQIRRSNTENLNPEWPTPPYDENDWAAAAAASIFAASAAWR